MAALISCRRASASAIRPRNPLPCRCMLKPSWRVFSMEMVIPPRLVVVKGIGRWTAEMALIFCLGRPDVLPVDDLGFVEVVRTAYGLEVRPTRKELLERGEVWRPYRTFATWYMWRLRRLTQGNGREKTRIVSL